MLVTSVVLLVSQLNLISRLIGRSVEFIKSSDC